MSQNVHETSREAHLLRRRELYRQRAARERRRNRRKQDELPNERKIYSYTAHRAPEREERELWPLPVLASLDCKIRLSELCNKKTERL